MGWNRPLEVVQPNLHLKTRTTPKAGQVAQGFGLSMESPQTHWSCVSVVIVFHREDLFLCVLVVFVPHPVLVILQEEPGSFFIKSFQVVADSNKFLLKLLTASLSIPCAVILSSHSLSSSPSLMSFSWALPRMSANVVLPACATHRAASGDFYCSSSDTPGMPEL